MMNKHDGRTSNYREIFPGTFTMGNVVCGFLSILSAFEGHITTACWLIVLAAFLDALDGKIARLSGGGSRFGVELDSLADVISFAVAPAVLVHVIKLNEMGRWGWVISVVFIMAASYRLARYNLMASTTEKGDFEGLPVPAAAITLVGYIILCYELWGEVRYGQAIVSQTILFSFLMVSQVTYETVPDKFTTSEARVKLVLGLLVGAALLFKPRLLLFPIGASYILFGILREMYRLLYRGVGKVTGRPNHERRRTNGKSQDE